MNGSRTNSTSFRFSDDVQKAIEVAKGNSIADKIEFIALDYKENKAQREKRIKDLDKEIEKKYIELTKVKKEVDNLLSVSNDLKRVVFDLTKCNTND